MSRTLPERTKPGAMSASDICSLPFQSVDDQLDVAQQLIDVETSGDLVGRQPAGHLVVGLHELTQLAPLVRRTQRRTLDDRVGVLARETALLDERGQQTARGEQPQAALQVLAHPLGT